MTMIHLRLLLLATLFTCGAATRPRQLSDVDEKVVTRYLSVPEGLRKTPSYYSEIYLSRARPSITQTEKEDLAQEWGSWTFVDPKAEIRPGNDFYDQYPNRDVPFAEFPDTAWQKDKDYLAKFLPEGIALTERAMEAILAEYGRGKKDMPDKDFEERSLIFKPEIGDPPVNPPGGAGGGLWYTSCYEGLKRRILHALMTEDRFTVAMGGHSAAAGHGNNFQQSYTLQIARILEPIFARLGVKASSRNFGQGGMGTTQASVASGDLYGRDVDILMWDSSMTERPDEKRGLLAIQALLSMDRAPLLWFQSAQPILTIYNLTGADVATYGWGFSDFFKEVETEEQFKAVPYAGKYWSCPKDLKASPDCQRWEGTCWADRTNFVWEGVNLSYVPENQASAPGGRAGWHPGNREHQIQGRSFVFPILKALNEVLTMWNSSPDYALEDSVWHVDAYYKGIKGKVVENKEAWKGYCSYSKISPKFCTYSAKARTEFTPRARPWETSLRAIMSGSESKNADVKSCYDPPDVYNPFLDPPEGAIDVLAIVENGIKFPKNLARVHDSATDMQGRVFTEDGTGSKHNPEIKGGKGWSLALPGSDNCDGEYDSWCQRCGGCLMYGHNDNREGILFDGFSGWLIFNLPKVEQGVIVLKFHTWSFFPSPFTNGWCSENNVEPCPARALRSNIVEDASKQMDRQLKPPVPEYCDAWKFEFAIDGKITSWDKEVFLQHLQQADRVVEFVTILDEDSWEGAKDVEVAMRMTGCGRQKPFSLTHIYWV